METKGGSYRFLLTMSPFLSAIVALFSFRVRSRASLELEVVALRHQIEVLKRKRKKRITLTDADRSLWVWLFKILPTSIEKMLLVQPRAVIDWHRQGFLLYWRHRSKRKRGPPQLAIELRELIRQLKIENPLWGIRRIRGELEKLGITVSESAIRRYLPKRYNPPSPTWRMFLREHMHETAAVDMFVVITLTYQLLYAMVIISHERRKILHIEVTDRLNQDWLSREIIRAFQSNARPTYLVRDRDPLYGHKFRECVRSLGIQEMVTARQSPWQNNYVERAIGTIRNECLNHVIVLNERHLRRVLCSFAKYYNQTRTHQSLGLDSPEGRPIDPPTAGSKIVGISQVGGLHHRYIRRAA